MGFWGDCGCSKKGYWLTFKTSSINKIHCFFHDKLEPETSICQWLASNWMMMPNPYIENGWKKTCRSIWNWIALGFEELYIFHWIQLQANSSISHLSLAFWSASCKACISAFKPASRKGAFRDHKIPSKTHQKNPWGFWAVALENRKPVRQHLTIQPFFSMLSFSCCEKRVEKRTNLDKRHNSLGPKKQHIKNCCEKNGG